MTQHIIYHLFMFYMLDRASQPVSRFMQLEQLVHVAAELEWCIMQCLTLTVILLHVSHLLHNMYPHSFTPGTMSCWTMTYGLGCWR